MTKIKDNHASGGTGGRKGLSGKLLRILLLSTLAVTAVYGIGLWKPSWVAEIGIWGVPRPYFACEETWRGEDHYLSCQLYYLTGDLRSKGQLKNDVWHGQALTYYRDGSLRNKRLFEDGLRTGKSFTYRPDGSLAQETEYHSDTEWTERQYYATGELRAVYEYKDTYPDGPQIRYGKSGQVLSHNNAVHGQYSNLDGIPLNGVRSTYYENGALMCTYRYRNGFIQGQAEGFRENGQRQWTSRFKDSRLSGRYRQYYTDGSLRLFMVFKNSNCLKEREYARDGKLVYWADHKPRPENRPPQPNKPDTGAHPIQPKEIEPENTQDYLH